MTKSGRKRKKADKAKVQLKKGKKSLRLPKGQNVTDSRVTAKCQCYKTFFLVQLRSRTIS